MDSLNTFFFSGYPYVVVVVFLIGTIYRYNRKGYQVTSLSAQFLEGKIGFWGSVPFHWGILMILLGHLAAFLVPSGVIAWNSNPTRLLIHEGLNLTFAVALIIGLLALIGRRLFHPRIKMVTTPMDLFLEFVLLTQALLGCWIALNYRWGSTWFAADLSPYLWSLITFSPQPEAVIAMPLVVKAHIIGAFSIFLIFPFTRLVHILVAPFHYINRPYQVVIWYWDRKRVRDSTTKWTKHRPRNT